MSSLLTALSANVDSTVYVWLASGTAMTGTLTSVATDLTVLDGTKTIDSTTIVAFSV